MATKLQKRAKNLATMQSTESSKESKLKKEFEFEFEFEAYEDQKKNSDYSET